jgi:hypothetical protein
MKSYTLCLLLGAGLLAAAPARAQTALIAHRSHSGSLRTFRPARAADNFGLPSKRLETEKIVWLRGTQAVSYGRWVSYHGGKAMGLPPQIDTLDLRQVTGEPDLGLALKRLREQYPKAKFVGFDSKSFREAAAAK